jgi:serine/threonine protein kinase
VSPSSGASSSNKAGRNKREPEKSWRTATLFIQMHLYPETLASWLKRPGRVVNKRESTDIFLQICEALRYIHSQGIM